MEEDAEDVKAEASGVVAVGVGGSSVINIASVAAIVGSNVKGPQEPSSPFPSAKGRLRR